ncbi:MAG: hypothetical protein GW938_05570 [Leptospira sp.]|nr:hypothetical protein [Leptospira sp.]
MERERMLCVNKKSIPTGIVVSLIIAFAVNCGASREVVYSKEFIPRAAQTATIPAATKKLWDTRYEKENLQQALKDLTQIAEENPGDYDVMVMLCRGYYLMADGHLYLEINESNASDIKRQQAENFDLGVKWCEKAMATNEVYHAKVAVGGAAPAAAFNDITEKELSALYWRYANLAKWSRIEGLMTLLENKSQFTATIERVEKLDKNYFHGAVNRYKGGANILSPTGNKSEGKAQLEASIKQAPNYFGTKVIYAEIGLRAEEEKAIKLLNEVINGNPKSIPEIAPEQMIEQRKAKKLLEEEF